MINRLMVFALVVMAGISGAFPASAQQEPMDILRTMNFRAGAITLGDNLAEIAQTKNFRYLNNTDTQTFLTRIWNNPPGAGKDALGMIIPLDSNPLEADGWAVIVTYDPSGYVSDEEAGKIDYDDLMREMQQAMAEASKQRVQKGQPSIELLGWARKPYYDPALKKLYWAKRLRFGGTDETLNYEIRILGRHGVLDLNVVAPMSALPSIDQRIQTILSMVHFNQGNTYAEFDPKIDTAAGYGLAGLIAGGVLAKAGFFKGLLALLLAFKKGVALVIFGGFAAFWGRIKLLFSGKPKALAASNPPPTDVEPSG